MFPAYDENRDRRGCELIHAIGLARERLAHPHQAGPLRVHEPVAQPGSRPAGTPVQRAACAASAANTAGPHRWMSPASRAQPARTQQARPRRTGVQQRQAPHERRLGDHQVPGNQATKAVPGKVDRPAVADHADQLAEIACEQLHRIGTLTSRAVRLVLTTLVVGDHPVTRRGDRDSSGMKSSFDPVNPGSKTTTPRTGTGAAGAASNAASRPARRPQRSPARGRWQPHRVGLAQRDSHVDVPATAASCRVLDPVAVEPVFKRACSLGRQMPASRNPSSCDRAAAWPGSGHLAARAAVAVFPFAA
jgi:hypothetical protein